MSEEEGPATKKLKSTQPNIKVVVGKGDDKTEHLYHTHQLASISPWIDEQLSDMLKEEKGMYEISLEDITTETWLVMMKFILSPLEARKMTHQDVMDVVAGYHKYEFTQGLAMCDQVLLEYMETLESYDKIKFLDIPFMVSAISTTHKYHLAKAHKTGVAFFKTMLLDHNVGDLNIRETDFTPSDIEKLVPTIESLVEQDISFLSKIMPYSSSYQCKTVEDIKTPTFPHIFCTTWNAFYSGVKLRQFSKRILLCGADWGGNLIADFKLTWSNDSRSYQQNKKKVSIDRHDYNIEVVLYAGSGWKIVGSRGQASDGKVVLWEVNVGGKHGELPPETGWQEVHIKASGNPEIKLLGS